MAETSPMPLFHAAVSSSRDTPAFVKTPGTGPIGLAAAVAAPGTPKRTPTPVSKADDAVRTAEPPVSAPGTGSAEAAATAAPLPLTEPTPVPVPVAVRAAPQSESLPLSTAADPAAADSAPVPTSSLFATAAHTEHFASPVMAGDKRKAQDVTGVGQASAASASPLPLLEKAAPDATAAPAPAKESGASVTHGESATKKAKTGANAVGVKKTSGRAKREKKPLAPVGKTARKTRSQGPVDV